MGLTPPARDQDALGFRPLTDDDGEPAGGILYSRGNGRAWIRSSRVEPLPDARRENPRARVEYLPAEGRYHLRYDARTRVAIGSVVSDAIGAIGGGPSPPLDVLFSGVDPATMDRLCSPRPDGTFADGDPVVFNVRGFEVTVRRHGDVDLRPGVRRGGARGAGTSARRDD